MANTNSPLVNYIKISPNRTSPRNHKIDTITIHCMAGQLSVESCGNVFASSARCASSNYGIGFDGRIGMYVEEKDRSWCTSNGTNDNRAITIEVASDSKHPYAVTDAAYNSLINLIADICKRNKIEKLLWRADRSLIGKIDQQNMTVHRWFANKACPGDYLYNKHFEIANLVNAKLGASSTQPVVNPIQPAQPQPAKEEKVIKTVQIITDLLNIRTGPSVNYAQVGTLKKGDKVEIVGTSNGWGKLKNNVGWISLNSKYSKTIANSKPAEPVNINLPSYIVGGLYKTKTELNIRTGPGTNYAKKTHNQLDANIKVFDRNKNGAFDKGIQVVCLETKIIGSDEVWMRCPGGWVCAYFKGSTYII